MISFYLLLLFVLVFASFFFSSGFLFSPSVSVVLAGGDFRALGGDFLPRVTCVHPSSSLLLGSFPVSVGVFVFFSGLFAGAVDGTGVLFTNGVFVEFATIVALLLCWWFFVGMTAQSGLFACNASTVVFTFPQPPTWLGPHNQQCRGLPGTLPCKDKW